MKQINITFNAIEDRLLLRMTDQTGDSLSEFRFWLTRRCVKLLWNVLYQILEIETLQDVRIGDRKTMIEFQEQAILSKTDFTTPYISEGAQTPLGADPILVSKIQVSKTPDGQQILSLKDEKDVGINITVSSWLIHSLRKLIADGIQIAQWDINVSVFSQPTSKDQPPRIIN